MLAGTILLAALAGLISTRCAVLSPCHAPTSPSASVTIHLDEPRPPIEAALIAESDQLTRACNEGQASACAAAGRIASALESRGYCRPDASGRWQKVRECAQINGKPDLTLGLPRAGSVNTGLQPMADRSWRINQRRKRGGR
jgi:hypothetical protein